MTTSSSSSTNHHHQIQHQQSSIPPFSYYHRKEEESDNNNNNGDDENDSNNNDNKISKSSIFGTSTNLVNTIVGAGIIGMPYAIKTSGFIAGILLVIFVGILTDKSLNILIGTASLFDNSVKKNGYPNIQIKTYEDLIYYPYGTGGRRFILLSMFFVAYGAMVAYLIIIKDTIPTIIGYDDNEKYQPEIVLIATSLLIILPISMQRDMASLAFTSLISVTCDIILVFYILFYSPFIETISNLDNGGFMTYLLQNDVIQIHTIFIGLGVLSTAMCCQHSSFIIYESLDNNTPYSNGRWKQVSAISISISTFLSLLLGVSGYLGFLDDTQGDVLNNFPDGSVEANVARALLAITMFFTYPMESFVGRHVLVDLIHNGQMDDDEEDIDEAVDPTATSLEDGGDDVDGIQKVNNTKTNKGKHTTIFCCSSVNNFLEKHLLHRRGRMTIALYVLTLLPALYFDDLGPVLSITGSIGASCMAYIGPGLIYLGWYSNQFIQWSNIATTSSSSADAKNDQNDVSSSTTKESRTSYIELSSSILSVCSSNQQKTTSSLQLQQPSTYSATTSSPITDDDDVDDSRCKPIWWYVFGFNVWYNIAVLASSGIPRRLAKKQHRKELELKAFAAEDGQQQQQQQQRQQQQPGALSKEKEETTITPTGLDFIIAIFYIVFGIIAMLLGLGTNIYVLMTSENE